MRRERERFEWSEVVNPERNGKPKMVRGILVRRRSGCAGGGFEIVVFVWRSSTSFRETFIVVGSCVLVYGSVYTALYVCH